MSNRIAHKHLTSDQALELLDSLVSERPSRDLAAAVEYTGRALSVFVDVLHLGDYLSATASRRADAADLCIAIDGAVSDVYDAWRRGARDDRTSLTEAVSTRSHLPGDAAERVMADVEAGSRWPIGSDWVGTDYILQCIEYRLDSR